MVSFVEGCLHNGTLLRPWATGTTFIGTVIALASTTLETNATLAGRALARNGAVTLDSNTVSVSSCSVPVNSPPVLSESFSQPTMVAGGDSTMTITMSNPNDTAATITSALYGYLTQWRGRSWQREYHHRGDRQRSDWRRHHDLDRRQYPGQWNRYHHRRGYRAAAAGTYINSLPSDSPTTSNGNNVAPARLQKRNAYSHSHLMSDLPILHSCLPKEPFGNRSRTEAARPLAVSFPQPSGCLMNVVWTAPPFPKSQLPQGLLPRAFIADLPTKTLCSKLPFCRFSAKAMKPTPGTSERQCCARPWRRQQNA